MLLQSPGHCQSTVEQSNETIPSRRDFKRRKINTVRRDPSPRCVQKACLLYGITAVTAYGTIIIRPSRNGQIFPNLSIKNSKSAPGSDDRYKPDKNMPWNTISEKRAQSTWLRRATARWRARIDALSHSPHGNPGIKFTPSSCYV